MGLASGLTARAKDVTGGRGESIVKDKTGSSASYPRSASPLPSRPVPSAPHGATLDGRISLRRRYLKGLAGPGNTDAVQVMAEFQRGVWEGFNVLPLTEQRAMQRREGILLFRRSL
jgi:hypothetical protein